MSIYKQNPIKNTKLLWAIAIFFCSTTVAFTSLYFQSKHKFVEMDEKSQAFMLAKAEARGKELARLKFEAHNFSNTSLAQMLVEEHNAEKQTQLKIEHDKKVEELGVTPIEDYTTWKNIGQGWQVRGVNKRFDYEDVETKHEDGSITTVRRPTDSGVCFEYALRRADGVRPKLTRIVFELFDENHTFVCPGICDVSGTDAGLYYVRTGGYDLNGKKPMYIRWSVAEVNMVKFRNTYPTR